MSFISRVLDVENSKKKVIFDYIELASQVNACKALGCKIVLTIGSWDMLHIGHLRYLVAAHLRGDILVVGVDSDRAIKKYKGPHRPIIPETERIEMLSYQACVDFITTVDDVDDKGQWQYRILKAIRPDVFVAVEDSYPEDQREQIRLHSRELVVLPRQAENTSSTQIIQNVIKGNIDIVRRVFAEEGVLNLDFIRDMVKQHPDIAKEEIAKLNQVA